MAGFGSSTFDPQGIAKLNITVDGQAAIPFPLTSANASYLTNQKLFQTPQMPPGQHILVVTYMGNLSTLNPVPLDINYFVLQVGPLASNSSINPSGNCSNSSSTPPKGTGSSNSSTVLIGAIIGVVGGIVLILLILALAPKRKN